MGLETLGKRDSKEINSDFVSKLFDLLLIVIDVGQFSKHAIKLNLIFYS